MPRLLFFWVMLLAVYAGHAAAAGLEQPNPEAAGLTTEGVARLDDLLASIERHELAAGGVALLERKGAIGYCKAFGKQSLEAELPMQVDTIFRIYSMTKPVTSVAAMMLYEEGKFALDDPVTQYLPELAGMKVGVEVTDADTGEKRLELVQPHHPPTMRELMSHTAGFAYGLMPRSLVDRMYSEGRRRYQNASLAENIRALGTMPLKHQPGTQWEYSISVDVLGRVVEVLSGQEIDAFFAERIFGPLGMVDTGFYVPEDKQHRLADLYSLSLLGKLEKKKDDPSRTFRERPALLMPGGGLVSTAADYLKFCRMLLNRGELEGKRLLKAETVDLMTTDLLGELPVSPMGYALGMTGAGFGLGFSVTREPFKVSRGELGEYNWGGAASTLFWIDPKQEMIGIYLIQVVPMNFTTALQFKKASYAAIEAE